MPEGPVDHPDSPNEGKPDPCSGPEFLEAVAVFLKTIPMYPDGHNRALAVTERLQGVLKGRGQATVVDLTDAGVRIGEVDVAPLSAGPKQFRDALASTGIARVVFDAAAPPSSFVQFARLLQKNVRLCQSSRKTFEDLWAQPIPGIALEEMRFSRAAFQETPEGDAREDEAPTPRPLGARGAGPAAGSGAGGSSTGPERGRAVSGTGGTGSGGKGVGGPGGGSELPQAQGPSEASDPFAEPAIGASQPSAPKPLFTPVETEASASKDVRELVRDDPELRDMLALVESSLLENGRASPARPGDDGAADVLEHVLRLLPLEARLDPAKGLEATRRVLRRFLEDLVAPSFDSPEEEGSADQRRRARLQRVVRNVFPRRPEDREELPLPEVAVVQVGTARREDDDSDAPFDVATLGPPEEWPATPTLDADTGIEDLAGVLTHVGLTEPEGPRRKAVRARLVETLVARPLEAPPPCLLTHLRDAFAVPPADRKVDQIKFLAGVAEEAGIDVLPSEGGWLPFEEAAALFPRLLRAYVHGGGSAGGIARRLGREAVLAQAAALLGPGGALADPATADRILSERSTDVLPFAEVLLSTRDRGRRAQALAAMRRLHLPSVAAVALRTVPDERLSDALLSGLCEDGFEGVDSKRFDAEAVAEIAATAGGRGGEARARTRSYAAASLSVLPRELVEPVLRALLRRRFLVLPTQPREVRRAAKRILRSYPPQALAGDAP